MTKIKARLSVICS